MVSGSSRRGALPARATLRCWSWMLIGRYVRMQKAEREGSAIASLAANERPANPNLCSHVSSVPLVCQYVRPDPRVVSLIETFQEKVAERRGELAEGADLPMVAPLRTAIVFTKIDKLVAHDVDFRQMKDDLHRISGVDDVFCVSGLRGQGVQDLRRFMCRLSQATPWPVDKDAYEETYGSSIVKEVIREKVFRAYYKEIPYAIDILVKEVTEDGRGVRVRAALSVPSASMRTIVIGSKGRAIRSVERAVCGELARVFGKEVRCVLGVVVS